MRWDVHYVEQTGSTNSDLLARAREGAPVGTVVWAGHQTAGRGRLGRTWEAPPGSSLLASILLAAEPVPFVTMARVALSLSDACSDVAGVDVPLKWPNDLLLGEAKLAGLLAEGDAGSGTVVVGIGCNVAWPPAAEPAGSGGRGQPAGSGGRGQPAGSGGRGQPAGSGGRGPPATSLASAPAVPEPGALLDGLLTRLDRWLPRPPDEVLASYRRRCATLGRTVRVDLAELTLEGTATGITSSGELEVAVGTTTQVVRSGDVVHVRAR